MDEPDIDPPRGPADVSWLAASLIEAGVDPDRAKGVVAASRTSAAIVSSEREERVGGTRLGGLPDLAVGSTWPVWAGVSMRFLAQIDLAEVPDISDRALLPAAGLLSIFFDGDDDRQGFLDDDPTVDGRGAVCVRHVAAGVELRRGEWPEDLSEWARHPGRAAELRPMLTLPQSDDVFGGALGLSEAEQQVVEAIGEVVVDGTLSEHWLLGNPLEVQGNVFYEMQHGWGATDSTALDASWRLLIQIGPDDEMNLEWGDGGTLYVGLLEADLRARRWDRARVTWQCY